MLACRNDVIASTPMALVLHLRRRTAGAWMAHGRPLMCPQPHHYLIFALLMALTA